MAAQICSSSKFVVLLLYLFFLMNILSFSSGLPFATSLSFNFTYFNSSNPYIDCDRTVPTNRAIELTPEKNEDSVGRATYSDPLHLWDKASGNLASFQTHFSFAIDSRENQNYGDGLTFFFAPNGSKLKPDISKGSGLGIGYDPALTNDTATFFAVEFDIYSNPFDPPEKLEHVGIDINSMKSIAYSIWKCDIMQGRRNDVWINYDSVTHNLSVTFTGFEDDNNGNIQTVLQQLHHVVDLRLNLPEWVTFGFSASTGASYAAHTLYSWDFNSILYLDDFNPTLPPSPSPGPNSLQELPRSSPWPRFPSPFKMASSDHSEGSKVGLAVGLGVGAAFILVAGLVMVLTMICLKKKKAVLIMKEEIVLGCEGPRKFSYTELARATNNFKEDKKLGEGGFGGVYKGFLRDLNCYVAVKRVSKGSIQGVKEYASEVNIISQLRHRNLVQLIGWCHERDQLVLVYEFMPNGSLDAYLFNPNNFLTWESRYKIAQGIASALLYLHEEWEKCVLHRDIKSSNVMLDSNFNAKLGDFGLARLVDHAVGSQTTALAGTLGYMPPECAMTGRASKESDVFSFGIVALEIACGRRPFNPNVEEGKRVMVEWVWELYGCGRLLEAADLKLQGSLEDEPQQQQQIECLMIVGLWCAHPDVNCRPSIRQAIHVLNFEAPLPVLPLQFPQLAYHPLPVNKPITSSSFSSNQDSVVSQIGNGSNSSNALTSSSQQTTSSSTSVSASTSLLYTR